VVIINWQNVHNIISRYYQWKLTTLSKVNEVITVLLTMCRCIWHLICVLPYYHLASLIHAFHLRNEVRGLTHGRQNSFTTTKGRSAVPGGQYRVDVRCRGRRHKQTHTEVKAFCDEGIPKYNRYRTKSSAVVLCHSLELGCCQGLSVLQ